MNNQLLPIIPRSENGVVTRGVRDKDDLDIAFELETSRIVGPIDVPPPNHTECPTAANLAQMDLTRSDDEDESVSSEAGNDLSQPVQALAPPPGNLGMDAEVPEEQPSDSVQRKSPSTKMSSAAASLNVFPELDSTPLADDHEVKFLKAAWLQFTSERPPFVRLNTKENPKTVTLAITNGLLPQTEVLANLVPRQWDSKSSDYTLDRNGERLIVKPIGGVSMHGNRGGSRYRTWSGQGNVFERAPIAFSIQGNTEEKPNISKDEDNLESDFEEISIQDSDHLGDEDYSPRNCEASDPGRQAQHGSEPQALPDLLEPPATRRRQARLEVNHDNEHKRRPKHAPSSRLGPAPRTGFPSLHSSLPESSTSALKISKVAAGKRSASNIIEDDRSPKRFRPVSANNFNNFSVIARIPPTLTPYKQERTILHVLLPGSTSEMVPIKLRSAMTISTFFSSVSAAVGVIDYENAAVAVMLGGEDGGPDKTIIVRRDMIDSFEVFLEVIDEARCWEEEGGRVALQLQMRRLRI
ncbi:MAG: hypothetical protein ASARMPREDX12_003438 [Alectoria sarmentosa]|nr:MAG: hypothetical protein ASARMPREDX12_003438 [Alectoria sarmentosa]